MRAFLHWVVYLLAFSTLSTSSLFAAEESNSATLLPSDTYFYVRISDFQNFVERAKDTSLGRIWNDPHLHLFVQHLSKSMAEKFEPVEKRIGVSMTDLMNLPRGEVALAASPRELSGKPVFTLLLEVAEDGESPDKIIRYLARNMESTTAKFDGVTVRRYSLSNETEAIVFRKHEMLIVTTDQAAAKQIIQRLNGEPGATLADRNDYQEIVRRAQAAASEPAQILGFVDPIAAARSILAGNTQAQLSFAFLPVLGLDGLKGIGGNLALATPDFDQVRGLHILLRGARTGVLKAIALETGDPTPESWVPEDVASYSTIYWNFKQSYEAVATVVDSLQGEGSLDRIADQWTSQFLSDVNFKEEVIHALDGRVILLTHFDPNAPLSANMLVAAKLSNGKTFAKTFDKIIASLPTKSKRGNFGGTTYYEFKPTQPPTENENQNSAAAAIVTDYVVLSTSAELVKKVIATNLGMQEPLANSLEYKLVASKMQRRLGNTKPSLFTFKRPEPSLRYWYNSLSAKSAVEQLRERGEQNTAFKILAEALIAHPLPPFEVFTKYLAPQGAVLVNDQSGVHYLNFTLRRN